MVVKNLPLVGYLVSTMCAKATQLSREDLSSVGAIALITAADAYDPTLGIPFGAYARRRIMGAFADDMRAADWVGRNQRQKIKGARSAEETLTASLGRHPSTAELAQVLGVSEKEVATTMETANRQLVTIEDDMNDYLMAETSTPEQEALALEESVMMRAAVEALPERMRIIVTGLFFENRSAKEIAAELGVTHCAISQQRTEAMRLLREGLSEHYGLSARASQDMKPSRSTARRREQYVTSFREVSRGGLTTAHHQREVQPAA